MPAPGCTADASSASAVLVRRVRTAVLPAGRGKHVSRGSAAGGEGISLPGPGRNSKEKEN